MQTCEAKMSIISQNTVQSVTNCGTKADYVCIFCKKHYCINCMYLMCEKCHEYLTCFWCRIHKQPNSYLLSCEFCIVCKNKKCDDVINNDVINDDINDIIKIDI